MHYAQALHAFVLKEAITTGVQHFFIERLGSMTLMKENEIE